jgi:hypothetical protein
MGQQLSLGRVAIGRRLIRFVAPWVVAGLGSQALALGLGDPNVASALGQPLQLTVPLVMDAGAELPQNCVRIVPGTEFGDSIPSLNGGRVTIDAEHGQLRIDGLQPINEPALRVAVELGCVEHIRREFALLLDPPAVAEPATNPETAGLALPARPAASLGLGMAQISAVLGQRLSIRVPVVGAGAGNLTADCVHLADPVSSEGAPVLRQAAIRVVQQDSVQVIEVTTPDPVTEPAVRLAMDVGCSEPLRREYAILLGLPVLAASNTAAGADAAGPGTVESVSKPSSKRTARTPKVVSAVPVVPAPAAVTRPAPVEALESAAQKSPVAASRADHLMLGPPQDYVASAGPSGAEQSAEQNVELLRRLDTMSKQIEALQAELAASRLHERELARRSSESREGWTWLMGALGGLLLGGALVMSWRQRQPQVQSDWEPFPSRSTQPASAFAAGIATTRTAMQAAAAPGIGGRGAMGSAPTSFGATTEPSLSDKNTEITVTELHDTVQVIKELYATVLERNTSGAANSSTCGRPERGLELDLRTPTAAGSPGPRLLGSESGSGGPLAPAAQPGPDRTEERFTELPTEIELDLDLSSVIRPVVPGGNTDMPAQPGAEGPIPARAPEPVAANSINEPAPLNEERMTQAPTEVLIDIDVGARTGFPDTNGQPSPRVVPLQRSEAERSRNAEPTLAPIDLQLDLNQPETKIKRRQEKLA